MKRNLFIGIGLALLAVALVFMLKDLFFSEKSSSENPYEYNLEKIRKGDSLTTAYKEIKRFKSNLEEIHGIALDQEDRIYVSGKKGIEIYDNAGILQKTIPLDATCYCIAIAATGDIFVGVEDHVEVYSLQGALEAKWKKVSSESVLTSIALSKNDVFVADAGEKVVFRYDYKGNLIQKIGEKDPQHNLPGFFIPSPYFDVALDPSGNLWIVDPGRHTVNHFTFDGKLVSSWGKASLGVEGFCGCCNPSNIAFLPDGSFITGEKSIERLKVYSKEGQFQNLIATPESFDEGTRGLDLAVDSQERILVVDPWRNQVRFFVKKI